MSPATSRDFQKSARQRLTTAKFLLDSKYTLDAMYIAGYAVECSLKALILAKTPAAALTAQFKTLTSGAKMHNFEALAAILRNLGVALPAEVTKGIRKSTWSTNLRYETGRMDTGETRAFYRTAQLVYDWVEGELP
jgi:HEPN domain-containing protein